MFVFGNRIITSHVVLLFFLVWGLPHVSGCRWPSIILTTPEIDLESSKSTQNCPNDSLIPLGKEAWFHVVLLSLINHDMIVRSVVLYVGTINWIHSLNLTIYEYGRPWLVDGHVAGYFVTSNFYNFSYFIFEILHILLQVKFRRP